MARRLLPKALRLVGVGIFIFFILRADLHSVLALVRTARWIWIAGVIALQAFMLITKAFRWWVLLGMMGLRLEFGSALRCFLSGYFAGVVTPGRLGEFMRVGFVRESTGCPLAAAVLNVFVDRLLDLTFLIYCGIAGVVWFGLVHWGWFAGAVLGGAGFTVLFRHERASRQMARRLRRLLPQSTAAPDDEPLEEIVLQTARILKKPAFYWPVILTLLANAVGFFGSVACVAWSLGLDVSYGRVSAGVAMNGALSLVPITIGGLGTREAVFYYVFGQVGIGMEAVVAFCTLNVLLILLLPALVCLPFFIRRQEPRAALQTP